MACTYRIPHLGYFIFWFLGLLIGSIEIFFYTRKQQLLLHGQATTGTVVGHFEGSRGGIAPIIEFTVNDVTYTYHHPIASFSKTDYPLRSPIEIAYLPGNPAEANLKETLDNKLIDKVFFSIALLFFIVPLIMYLMRKR